MKRIRLSIIFTALAVMAIGVQAVNACPSSLTLYYDYGRYDCNLTSNANNQCDYSCRFHRIYFA